MVTKGQRTYAATEALLSKSRDNVSAVEQVLNSNGDMTTGEIARTLKWTINKTNSTLYKMKERGLVNFFYHEDKNHRMVKGIKLVSEKEYFE